MKKLLIVETLTMVLLFSISFFLIQKNIEKPITKYIQFQEEDSDVELPNGFFPCIEGSPSMVVSKNQTRYLLSNYSTLLLERKQVELPLGYEVVVKNGSMVEKGTIIAKSDLNTIKSEISSRFLYEEDGMMEFETLKETALVLSFHLDYDVVFDENSFYIMIAEKKTTLTLINYTYDKDKMMYQFNLSGLTMNDSLINGQTVGVFMEAKITEGFLVPKQLVFQDDNRYFVKKVFQTSKYGDIYQRKYVEIKGENTNSFVVLGIAENEILTK